MQTAVEIPVRRAAPVPSATPYSSLDALAKLDSAGCEVVFGAAEPFKLHDLAGHPRGRVLAIPRLDAGLTAAFARQLEHIFAKTYAAEFAQYRAHEFFPTNTEVDAGALSFTI